jgi:hypothetical protein
VLCDARLDIEWFSAPTHATATLCVLKPAVSSFMRDVHTEVRPTSLY